MDGIKIKLDTSLMATVFVSVTLGLVAYHMIDYVILPKIAPKLSSVNAGMTPIASIEMPEAE